MKKMLMMVMVLAMLVPAVFAGSKYKETSVTVTNNATSASVAIDTYDFANQAMEIERIFVYNYSGNGTGTVTFWQTDYNVTNSIVATSSALYLGQMYSTRPRTAVYAGSDTNAVCYLGRKVTAFVSQLAVVSNTVYKIGVFMR